MFLIAKDHADNLSLVENPIRTLLRWKDGKKFLLYRTTSPELANHQVDPNREFILCVPNLSKVTTTRTIDKLIAFFYVLIQGFPKPYSVGMTRVVY